VIEQVVKLARQPARDAAEQPLIFRSRENSVRLG
jgi:pyrroloquinoline quinone biosynthesis protein E